MRMRKNENAENLSNAVCLSPMDQDIYFVLYFFITNIHTFYNHKDILLVWKYITIMESENVSKNTNKKQGHNSV